jgi:hypothetical protein
MNNKNRKIKLKIREMSCGICEVCGSYNWGGHIAHRIAETKTNIKVYGKEIIDHEYNKAWVCSLDCNDKCNIGNKPSEVKRLINKIMLYR